MTLNLIGRFPYEQREKCARRPKSDKELQRLNNYARRDKTRRIAAQNNNIIGVLCGAKNTSIVGSLTTKTLIIYHLFAVRGPKYRFFSNFAIIIQLCHLSNNALMINFKTLILSIVALTAGTMTAWAEHELPRHRAYEWSGLSLDDLRGDIRVPVIFVDFGTAGSDNETKVSAANQKTWISRLNTTNSANHMGADGSVNDYFLAQSYGLLNVTFESVGNYTASGSAASYADSNAWLARTAISSLTDVDWSRFDANGDGEVECVLLIYAGHADGDDNAQQTPVKSIYPHQDWLRQSTGSRLKMGDAFVQSYVWMNNLRNGSSTAVNATNTACHELSHGLLDLPDYYKNLVSYMGQYDAMCYGFRQTAYGSATNHCCDFCAFNRMYLGWLTPFELTEPCHVKLQPLSQQAEACIIFDPNDANHFFLLENRQALANSWDAHLPASGLVVTEVHWNRQRWESHSLNGSATKDIQLVCAADNSHVAYPNDIYYNFDQSLIPYGSAGRTSIGSAVSPVFETLTVTGIRTNRDGSVEFDFMGGGPTVDFTGIGAIRTDCPTPSAAGTYNLQGQPVRNPHGLTISGGRVTLAL